MKESNLVYNSVPVSQSVPVYPGTQAQLYSLMPSVQFPPLSQGLAMQSLTSTTKIKFVQYELLYSDVFDRSLCLNSKCDVVYVISD